MLDVHRGQVPDLLPGQVDGTANQGVPNLFPDIMTKLTFDTNPAGRNPPHSVVTNHLIDKDGEPTRAALDRVLSFFKEQLAPAA